MLRPLLILTLLASSRPVFAQQESGDSTIRTNVPLVLAPVTVSDRKGNFIDGLTVDDFALTDDGIPQKLRLDTSDTVLAPVSLVVLIQSSGISTPEMARISRVGSLIKPLLIGEVGRAAVLSFDTETRVFQEFTGDSGKISAAFQNIDTRTIKDAKLIDAVAEAVKMLDTRPPNSRRILLILSESRDRGSKMKLADAVELAQRAGVVIYPETYSAQASAITSKPENNPPMPAPAGANVDIGAALEEFGRLGKSNAADALARATGGRHLGFLTQQSLEKVLERTGEEIHSQYLLSFVPMQTKNTGFHVIKVAVKSHPEAEVRVRPGYWPQK